ncbi:MAG: magnesium transporter [Firmicutes bacterium]|nr:magnesium transporter [Bacillota bacterium]
MVQPAVWSLFREGRIQQLLELVKELHPADLVETLHEFSQEEQEKFFLLIPHEQSAIILQEMEVPEAAAVLAKLPVATAAEILKEMYSDEAVDILAELPKEKAAKLLMLMKEAGEELKELLAYEEDTSGGLMATEFVAVPENLTVGGTLAYLRKVAPSAENAYYIYVVKRDKRLVGVISLRELVVAPLETRVRQIMHKKVVKVPEDLDQEEVVRLFEKYSLLVLPVVDKKDRLVGVITVDDVMAIAKEETTEDIHKAGSITPLRMSYKNAGVLTLYSKRVGWLLVLILVNLISSGVIAAFEETLSVALSLAFFIPLLIDTGGNTGCQSATLMVRALVTGDVKLSSWFQTFGKELLVGMLLGITLGLAGWLLGVFRGGAIIGVIVSLTMLAIVVIANLVGVILPFILTRLRLDPAVASSPLITTIMDAIGLLTYFTIARMFLAP